MSRSKILDSDRADVAEFVKNHWGSEIVMSSGRAFKPHEEQGYIERCDGTIVGLLTCRVEDRAMEILTLNATLEGKGIGTSLMLNAIEAARTEHCNRIWLTTTNDNLRGVGFYQRLGYRLVKINLGAVDDARRIKPEIPKVGHRGVPIHDELVMELELEPYLDEGTGGGTD